MLVEPQALIDAAEKIGVIGAGLDSAATSAARAIVAIPAMGADEVSAAVAALFGSHGQAYQQAAQQMAALRNQITQNLAAGGPMYADSEDGNQAALEYAAARDRLWHATHSAARLGGPHAPGSPVNIAWWVWQFEQVANGVLRLK